MSCMSHSQADIHLFKVIMGAPEKKNKICSLLIIKTPEGSRWRHFSVFIVNFEEISHIVRLSFLRLSHLGKYIDCAQG